MFTFILQEPEVDCSQVDSSGSSCCVISDQCSCVQRRFHDQEIPARECPIECRASSKASPALVVAVVVVLVVAAVGLGLLQWRRWKLRKRAAEEKTKVEEQEEATEVMIRPRGTIEL